MKFMRFLFLIVVLCSASAALAEGPIPFEYLFGETYVGDGSVQRNDRRTANFDESDTVAQVILTPRSKLGILRLGVEYERFSFGFGDNAALPNRLQSLNAVIGLDTQFSDSLLVRLEAQPGFYGEDFSGGKFNVPVVFGGTYLSSDDLQFVLGVSIDADRKYPVLPGGGIRWHFRPQLTLNAVLPTPRLEYEVTKGVTAYVGANLKETSFRVNDDFGRNHGDRRLDNAILTYTEVRVGAGIDWKLTSWLTANLEGGYQPYRTFDFYRANARYHEDGGAPYGMLALHGAF